MDWNLSFLNKYLKVKKIGCLFSKNSAKENLLSFGPNGKAIIGPTDEIWTSLF
jgi:hypothetical protein